MGLPVLLVVLERVHRRVEPWAQSVLVPICTGMWAAVTKPWPIRRQGS